jgi:hypothetical protein
MRSKILGLIALCGLSAAAVAQPTVWNFDGTFDPANAGPATMYWFAGIDAGSFGVDSIAGVSTGVLNVPALPPGQGLHMNANVPGNGNATSIYINQYTVIYDIKDPRTNPFMCYFNTTCGTGNDGDAFRNPAGGIGISGDYEGTIEADVWHRVAFVIDLTQPSANRMRKFIDGRFVGQTSLGGFDGRHALYSSADNPACPSLVLFGDDTSDTSPISLSSFLFEARAYTDAEITALGCATGTGIGIGAPRTCSVPPTVAANLTPSTAAPGAACLLTAAASPGSFPASTSYTVTADLSSLGLSASQAMFDNGTNGDVTANDGIFTIAFTLPTTGLAPGNRDVTVTLTDNIGRIANSGDSIFILDPNSGTYLTIIDFNNSAAPLVNTVGVGQMEFWDRVIPGNTEAITQFNTTTSFGIADINGQVANVAFLPRYFGDEGLRYNNLSPGNGGGVYVNQYTMISDIYFPADDTATYFPFYNTNNTNSNAGDLLARFSDRSLGFDYNRRGDTTYSAPNAFEFNTWHRIAFVLNVDTTSANGAIYVDGVPVFSGPVNDSLDTYFSLYSTTDGDPLPDLQAYSHFGTDPTGPTNTANAYLNSFLFVDRAMSAAEIAALGCASAAGLGSAGICPSACSWQADGCFADFNNDDGVDGDDVIAFFADWDNSNDCADVDDSDGVDGDDVILFFASWDVSGTGFPGC